MKKNSYLSLGVMSGTSNDGIDISLIQSDGKNKLKIQGSMYVKYNLVHIENGGFELLFYN